MLSLIQLVGDIDVPLYTNLWKELSNLPYWSKDLVWIHGNLLPGNILIENNRLSAVIDFADVGLGDHACDLIPAWCLFNAQSRQNFRMNLEHTDENTWERGRGWALSIALTIPPYYKHTNLHLVAVARRILEQVLL